MSEHLSDSAVASREPDAVGIPAPSAQVTPTATAPRSLLEEMQELLASVNADLACLDAALQASGSRAAESRADGPDDPSTASER